MKRHTACTSHLYRFHRLRNSPCGDSGIAQSWSYKLTWSLEIKMELRLRAICCVSENPDDRLSPGTNATQAALVQRWFNVQPTSQTLNQRRTRYCFKLGIPMYNDFIWSRNPAIISALWLGHCYSVIVGCAWVFQLDEGKFQVMIIKPTDINLWYLGYVGLRLMIINVKKISIL